VTLTTPCEQQTFDLQATFLQPLQLSLGNDTTLCTGDSLLLDAGLADSDRYQPVYDWQHGEQTARIVVREPGLYTLQLRTRCQELTDSIRIDYLDRVYPSLGRDTFLCAGERLLLDVSSPVEADYIWEDGSRAAKRTIEGPGSYWVQVFTACESQGDSLLVSPCERCDVYRPTAFSPNSDGVNDQWRPYSDCQLGDYRLKVFDRWGGLLYASEEADKGWDGRRQGEDAPAGVYVFVLDYTVVENGRSRTATATGSFQLLR
jgi:gliding motility-associated-like protein